MHAPIGRTPWAEPDVPPVRRSEMPVMFQTARHTSCQYRLECKKKNNQKSHKHVPMGMFEPFLKIHSSHPHRISHLNGVWKVGHSI